MNRIMGGKEEKEKEYHSIVPVKFNCRAIPS